MRQVALIGGGRSWVRAPYNDPAWEVWAHASVYKGIPRADRWFEVHTPALRAQDKSWSADYKGWLTVGEDPDKPRTSPVYVLDNFATTKPEIPVITNDEITNKVVIPLREIEAWLHEQGGYDDSAEYLTGEPSERESVYTTSTTAHMFKQALFEGVERIGIWGINYDEHAEYLVQRPCLEYWIGFARAKGRKVYVTPTSPLGRDKHIYGLHGPHKHLVHTGQPFKIQPIPLTVGQLTGRVAIGKMPPEIQALIDEEKERWGVDTTGKWDKMLAPLEEKQKPCE